MNAAAITATAKKHWVPISLGVASLVFVAASQFVLPGYFAELKTRAQDQAGVVGQLHSVRQAGGSLTAPVIKPGGEAKPMPGLPSANAVQRATAALEDLSKQANDLIISVTTANQRSPVFAPGLWSATQEKPTASNVTQFMNAYLRRLNAVAPRSPKEAEDFRKASILGGTLNSANPPSQAELNALIQQETSKIRERLVRDTQNNQLLNEKEINAEIEQMRRELPGKVRAARAARSLIYVSPDAFAVDQRMVVNPQQALPSTVETFNAQVSLWQQETIAEAVAAANAELGATKVADAAIKHIVSLQLRWTPVPVQPTAAPSGFGPGGFGAPTVDPNAPPAPPAELTIDAAAPIARNHQIGPLGHQSNAFYDPYPFTLTLRVDARRVPQVLAALPRNRLLAINSVSISSVEVGLAAQQGYLYGPDPVAELVIDGDVLFVRSWMIPFMPPAAKQFYQTKNAAPATPAG
jgi:hypothetical protein